MKDTFNVDEVITQISSDTDIILIEGLKNMSFPKIEVIEKKFLRKYYLKRFKYHSYISDLLLDI